MSEMHEVSEPALERFVFFSDAVFAIAITLLALEIKPPDPGLNAGEAAWEAALLHLTPSVVAFVLGFYVIGNIWTAHHEVFRLVRRFDSRLLAPNMLLLFAVVLVPVRDGADGNNHPRARPLCGLFRGDAARGSEQGLADVPGSAPRARSGRSP